MLLFHFIDEETENGYQWLSMVKNGYDFLPQDHIFIGQQNPDH